MSVRQFLVTRVVVSHRNHPNIRREHLETLLMPTVCSSPSSLLFSEPFILAEKQEVKNQSCFVSQLKHHTEVCVSTAGISMVSLCTLPSLYELMRVSIRGTSQKSNALPYFISILSDVNCDRRITGLQLALEQFTAEREAAGMKISTSKEWLILG